MQTAQVPTTPPKGIDDALAAGVPIAVIRGNAPVLREIQKMKAACEPAAAPGSSTSAGAQQSPPGGNRPPPVDTRPELDVGEGDLSVLVRKTWAVIQARNDPPRLYQSAAGLAYLGQTSGGDRFIARHSLDSARLYLADQIRCEKYNSKTGNMAPANPPDVLVKSILATTAPPVPVVTRIVEAPVVGRDGEIMTQAGYHAGSQTFYAPAEGFVVPAVPERPTPADVHAAREMLREPIRDFPFTSASEFAHAVAAMLLPFVRELITGPTPLHLVVKPTPGTGAGLLCDVIATLATGRRASPMAEARDEDEQRKRLTAYLIEGREIILLDNLSRLLSGAPLAVALTADTWADRVLGSSTSVQVPVRCLWLATGNNVQTSTEMARRIVRIRLDAHIDQPHRRALAGFRHPDLIRWVTDHRAELVAACLTLVQAWVVAGRPAGATTLGSYESWAAVMGGILEVAGIQGFLGNLDEFYAEADSEGGALRAFIQAWWDRWGQADVVAGDLFQMASEALELGDGSEQGRKVRWGKRLASLRDRVFGTLRVVQSGLRHSAKTWCLQEITDGGNDGPGCPTDADLFSELVGGVEVLGDCGNECGNLPLLKRGGSNPSSPNPPLNPPRVNDAESQSNPGRGEDGEDFSTSPEHAIARGGSSRGQDHVRAGAAGSEKSSPSSPSSPIEQNQGLYPGRMRGGSISILPDTQDDGQAHPQDADEEVII